VHHGWAAHAQAQPSMAGLAHHAGAERPFYAPHGYGYGASSRAPSPAVLESGMANGATAGGVAREVTTSQQEEASCTIDLNLRL
jgi:hypothetical protein